MIWRAASTTWRKPPAAPSGWPAAICPPSRVDGERALVGRVGRLVEGADLALGADASVLQTDHDENGVAVIELCKLHLADVIFRHAARRSGAWRARHCRSPSGDRSWLSAARKRIPPIPLNRDPAVGVITWGLPPGDTDRRLAEALESGLSGAVLLVTAGVRESRAIRTVELPRLLDLARSEAFTFSIASSIESEDGKLDYEAPDRLLGQRPGTLEGMKQQPIGTASARADVASAQARRRIEAIRSDIRAAGGALVIDVQTRIPPFATRADADLMVRLRPPLRGYRRPPPAAFEDLRLFLAELPQLCAGAGAAYVHVRGGAHLSVAFALGAALPTTLVGRVEAADAEGRVWLLDGNAQPGPESMLVEASRIDRVAGVGPVAVFLDLLPARSDAAFDDFVAAHEGDFVSVLHLRPAKSGDLEPRDAAVLVGDAAQRIRHLAGEHQTVDGLAALTGHLVGIAPARSGAPGTRARPAAARRSCRLPPSTRARRARRPWGSRR